MREIKDSQLQYFCNGIGELHECGKRVLDSVEELPQPLQRPYLEYWTAEWNLYCYIAFLDGLPGILLCAEFDDDYCQKQGIPIEYEAQYTVLFHYGERLEKLAHEINPHGVVGVSFDSACDPQIMLFVPTEQVPLQDVLKLYYLMDQYGYHETPDGVRWSVKELTAFVKRLRLIPEIESQMLASLDTDVELGTPTSDTDCLNCGLHGKMLWGRFGLMLELTGAEYATVTSGGEAAHALIREKIELGEFALDGESYFPAMETSQPDKWPVREDILFEF
jgi:hypothetical protein